MRLLPTAALLAALPPACTWVADFPEPRARDAGDGEADADAGACDPATCDSACRSLGAPGGDCAAGECRCLGGPDADADADDGPACPPGTWCDPVSGLMWQDPPDGTRMHWYAAGAQCDRLSLGGRGDWSLPTINQLRSFIRGCTATMTGGECGVSDECLRDGCGSWPPCDGCDRLAGPGSGGCYWDAAVSGSCDDPYWSSSSQPGPRPYAWHVSFSAGLAYPRPKTSPYYVRSVRREP
jgi:hypothetical protein